MMHDELLYYGRKSYLQDNKICQELCPPRYYNINILAVFISWVLIAYIEKDEGLNIIPFLSSNWTKIYHVTNIYIKKCQILSSSQIGIRCSHHTENIVLTKLLVPTSVDVTTESFSDEITAGLIDSLVFALCGNNHTCAQIRRPLLDIEVSGLWL